MAESEKPDSSTGKAKTKSSFLDEDISKDFLSSWKSMSVTGDNDMDFNFEPVAKGKKKAFDFGMDMDFSLDDAFGKMPSFNMPDIDFSSSPKKTSKSKEKKSEEESAKGSRQEKNDKFSFSFDFNGMDDFDLDKPTTRGGKKAAEDKISKQANSSCETDGKEPKQAASSREDATHKELPESEVAVNPKPDFPVEQVTSLNVSSFKGPSHSTTSIDQQKGTQMSMDKVGDVDTLESIPENCMARETSSEISSSQANDLDFSSIAEPIISHMVIESEEAYVSPEKNRILSAHGIEEDTLPSEKTTPKQMFAEETEKVLAQAISSNEKEVCSPNEKLDDASSEAETLQGEFSANALLGTDSITLNSDMSPSLHLTEKSNNNEEEKVAGVDDIVGNHSFTSDNLARSATNLSKRMIPDISLSSELQKSGLKDPPASGSGPSSGKSMLTRFKLSGASNSSMLQGIHGFGGTKHNILERSKRVSTPMRDMDFCEGNVEKLDDSPSSCAKDFIRQDSAVEKKEKNASRDGDSNKNEEIQTKMVIDPMPRDGQAKKDGFRLLDKRILSIDVKPSCIQLPSLVAPERESKPSNQGSGKRKETISSIAAIQKSNVGKVNRLSSTRTDKTVPTLPSLRISGNTTTNKQLSSTVQDPKSVVSLERSEMMQVKSKMVSPVNVQKQLPPIISLKRKPNEAADDIHPSKRLSPSGSRMSVSARENENEGQTKGTLSGESKKNVTAEKQSPKFDFYLEANMENLGFILMESDANVEKAEACAKELDDICSMLKKKHDEAKELLVRAFVNNNNLLMLNHPICEEKICEVQRLASRLTSREQKAAV